MFNVVSSNPGTIYWMDIFHIPICCKICNVWLKRQKIKEKVAGVGPFLKSNVQAALFYAKSHLSSYRDNFYQNKIFWFIRKI